MPRRALPPSAGARGRPFTTALAASGRLAALIVLVWVAGCSSAARHPAGSAAAPSPPVADRMDGYRVPRALDDGWATAPLDAVAMDRRPIEEMTGAIRRYPGWNIHAVLIERDGRLVYEEYFAGEDQRLGVPLGRVSFDDDTRHDLRSVTKSVVSALVGIALGAGAIRSIDEPIAGFFPEPPYAELALPPWRAVTLRHALTMSAVVEWNESLPYTDPRNDERRMTSSTEPIRFVLSRPSVLNRESGGITTAASPSCWRRSCSGRQGHHCMTTRSACSSSRWGSQRTMWSGSATPRPLRARDLAKFGSLYLHDGRWGGRQVLPPGWVTESTRRHVPLTTPTTAFGTHGYGYQWWHTCYWTGGGTLEAHTAAGNGQQRIHILPAYRLVVTVLAGRYNDPSAARLTERLLLEYIIPALRPPTGPGSMPEPAGCRANQTLRPSAFPLLHLPKSSWISLF